MIVNQIQQIRKSMTVTERETTYQHLIGAAGNDWEVAAEVSQGAGNPNAFYNIGNTIDFVINRGADGNNSYDSTAFDPTISY